MGVPACFSMDLVSTHGLVTTHEVFDRPRKNVVDSGFAVRGRGAFVKREVGGIVPVERPLEDLVIVPVSEDFFFQFGKLQLVW